MGAAFAGEVGEEGRGVLLVLPLVYRPAKGTHGAWQDGVPDIVAGDSKGYLYDFKRQRVRYKLLQTWKTCSLGKIINPFPTRRRRYSYSEYRELGQKARYYPDKRCCSRRRRYHLGFHFPMT